ncbi:MAG: phosphoribosylformylglycinamidine synthase subunit PurL [Thermoanaerobaculia bacterium]|nr:phosphoribosylformylglycinamidine synthase subunit PurL [Thermoanaerobaculia bacterium]
MPGAWRSSRARWAPAAGRGVGDEGPEGAAGRRGAGARPRARRRGVRAAGEAARAHPDLDRARDHLRPLVRALLVQVVEGLPARVPDERSARPPGPRRERRRRRHRPRLGGGLQDGEPQPPELHRAVPGCGHRRGRHPARRLHHGRAPHRLHGLAALRGHRRAADAVARRRRGAGVGDYGNCVGVPTVGGETGFHPSYDGNILVNAFALGIARRDRIFHARAAGVGNSVLYAGSRTGRDGIHGATMASESFDAESEQKRPTVQVGDPFTEKVLLEACLEAMRSSAIVAIQDMGAAGLTSSSLEMAARGGMGVRLDLDRVPLREPGLTPYEIMLSESQERMVLVVQRGREEEIARVFRRWGLEVARIGEVTREGRAEVRFQGRLAADLPIGPLTDQAPVYRRPVAEPPDLAARQAPPEVPVPDDPAAALRRLLATPELASKEWVYRQYDHTVRTSTVAGPGADAAVLLLKGTPMGLAMTCDVNPVYCHLDPRRGGAQAVAEAVRNLACVGAEPVGLTDCLNFGSPEIPEVMWEFRECVRGMAEACRALEVPVVSGNVSLYNTTEGRSIHPTPTVAMVGLVPDLGNLPEGGFSRAGDRVLLLGASAPEFGGSAYLRLLHGIERGRPPAVDLDAEGRLARLLRQLVGEALLRTAHDLAEGGLAVALAEATFPRRLGATLRFPGIGPADLFAESQARAVVAVPPRYAERVLRMAEEAGVEAHEAGEVGGGELRVEFDGGVLAAEVAELERIWSTALPLALGL